MDVAEVNELVVEVAAVVAAACRDRDELTAAVDRLRRVRAWVESSEVAVAALLAGVTSCPEAVLASAGHRSMRDADRVAERTATAAALPAFGAALAGGAVNAEHLDVMSRAWRRLEPAPRPQLADAAGRLGEVAAHSTAAELELVVKAEIARLDADGGTARLERQRRATRLRTWVDRDGMWRLSGAYDPVSGVDHGRARGPDRHPHVEPRRASGGRLGTAGRGAVGRAGRTGGPGGSDASDRQRWCRALRPWSAQQQDPPSASTRR